MIAGVQQMILDQSPSWTEIISCLAAVAAVIAPLTIWWVKHNKTKK